MSSSCQFSKNFRNNWQAATGDTNLGLYGFRRFKTSHLLNIRFLEDEVAQLDHILYQAGLSLGTEHSPANRLGLEYCRRNEHVPSIDTTITAELVLKLRDRLKQYDDAIITFNKLMSMQVFSLIDDEKQCSTRTDITLPEMYKTRLLRIDLEPRSRTDPFHDWIHDLLRDFRYWRLKRRSCKTETGGWGAFGKSGKQNWSYQDSAAMANMLGRFTMSLITGILLIVPLALLSSDSNVAQLLVVDLCILTFSYIVATTLRVSNFEMMAISAAYAAVMTVFVAN